MPDISKRTSPSGHDRFESIGLESRRRVLRTRSRMFRIATVVIDFALGIRSVQTAFAMYLCGDPYCHRYRAHWERVVDGLR